MVPMPSQGALWAIGAQGPRKQHVCVAFLNMMFQPQARSSRERTCYLWYLLCVVFVLCLLPCCTLAVIRCDFSFDWAA